MFGLADYMNPLDVRQYLYILSDILSVGRESESVFGLADYMNPLDVRQYLYCLTYYLLAESRRVCLVLPTT